MNMIRLCGAAGGCLWIRLVTRLCPPRPEECLWGCGRPKCRLTLVVGNVAGLPSVLTSLARSYVQGPCPMPYGPVLLCPMSLSLSYSSQYGHGFHTPSFLQADRTLVLAHSLLLQTAQLLLIELEAAVRFVQEGDQTPRTVYRCLGAHIHIYIYIYMHICTHTHTLV